MSELEAIAIVYGISLEDAENIYVDDIPDEVYEDVLKLINGQ